MNRHPGSNNVSHPQILFYGATSNGRVNAVFWALAGGALLFTILGLFASHVF